MAMSPVARDSSNCKRQTRLPLWESAPLQQTRNCLTIIKVCSCSPDGCLIPRRTGRLTVGLNITLNLTPSYIHPVFIFALFLERREGEAWERSVSPPPHKEIVCPSKLVPMEEVKTALKFLSSAHKKLHLQSLYLLHFPTLSLLLDIAVTE
jgi:hypothetical protein